MRCFVSFIVFIFIIRHTAINNNTVVIRFNVSWHSLRPTHTAVILGPIVKAVNRENVNTILFVFMYNDIAGGLLLIARSSVCIAGCTMLFRQSVLYTYKVCCGFAKTELPSSTVYCEYGAYNIIIYWFENHHPVDH